MSAFRVITIIGLFFILSFNNSTDYLASVYIENYKDLAIVEMYRTGIPASITLAQGLHESNYGTSRLAKEANNHFGIKCKSWWTGKTYYHKDDDYNQKGELVESCFRAYNNDLDSYIDRSNFLKYSERYSILFTYDKTDYLSWAYGLKQCGYATDATYTHKLIGKIEKYVLSDFDRAEDPFKLLVRK